MAIYTIQRLFSKKKKEPKGLRRYKDYDLKHMTRGQKLAALEEEDETANHNMERYVTHSALRGMGHGAATGAAVGLGLGLASKHKVIHPLGTAALGGFAGAGVGVGIGSIVGTSKGESAGHNRDKRTKKLARKMDDYARAHKLPDDDFEYRNNDRIKMRKAEERAAAAERHARNAEYYSARTYINSL